MSLQLPTIPETVTRGLFLAAVCFAADFFQFRHFGPLTDDWSFVGPIIWDTQESLFQKFLAQANTYERRPLRSVESILLWTAYKGAGFSGIFLTLWAALSANAILLYVLLKRRWPEPLALLGALLFLLFPSDTTHTWPSYLVARLALGYCFVACLLFAAGHYRSSIVACLAAVFSYELSLFVFVLAPWFADGGTRKSVYRGFSILAGALSIYFLWRLAGPLDLRVSTTWNQWDANTAYQYLMEFPRAVVLTCLVWPLKSLIEVVHPQARFAALLFLGFSVFTIRFLRRGFEFEETQRAYSIETKPPLIAMRTDLYTWKLLGSIAWGSLGIMAAASLSFWAAPSTEISVVSRYNYFFSPGGAIVITATLAILFRFVAYKTVRTTLLIVAIAIASAMFGFRVRIQSEWSEAATRQRSIMREIVAQLPAPPANTRVIVDYRENERTRSINAFSGVRWESEAVFRWLYGPEISGVVVRDVPSARNELQSSKEPNLAIYEVARGKRTWLRRQGGSPAVRPQGPALEYIMRE